MALTKIRRELWRTCSPAPSTQQPKDQWDDNGQLTAAKPTQCPWTAHTSGDSNCVRASARRIKDRCHWPALGTCHFLLWRPWSTSAWVIEIFKKVLNMKPLNHLECLFYKKLPVSLSALQSTICTPEPGTSQDCSSEGVHRCHQALLSGKKHRRSNRKTRLCCQDNEKPVNGKE